MFAELLLKKWRSIVRAAYLSQDGTWTKAHAELPVGHEQANPDALLGS